MIYKYSRGGFDDMKHKGEQDFTIDAEEHGEAAAARDDRKWNDRMAAFIKENKIEVPYAGRPKGKGFRMDFYAPGQLPDIALEIKEATGKRFKNLNDIHRAAHYIGIYLMRSMEVKTKAGGWFSELLSQLAPIHAESHMKTSLREEFHRHFEQFALGAMSEEKLERVRRKILKSIPYPDMREWAEGEFEDMMDNPAGEFKKLYNRITVQRHREKKKQLGLRVVGGEEE
jgi:hypothetical protein